ncbi:MAG: hypothetical protein KDD73_15380 [Anaerolineales bacterium]|nr:hypothetical protein [Anaerolineales bacterium]
MDVEQLALTRPASLEEALHLLRDVLPLGGPVIVNLALQESPPLPHWPSACAATSPPLAYSCGCCRCCPRHATPLYAAAAYLPAQERTPSHRIPLRDLAEHSQRVAAWSVPRLHRAAPPAMIACLHVAPFATAIERWREAEGRCGPHWQTRARQL